MKKQRNYLYTLEGIAEIGVGLFVLTFAILATKLDIAFVSGVYSGEPIDFWI